MRFLELKQHLSRFPIFTLADIRFIEPDFHLPRLSEWQKKGYLQKVVRGKYIFTDLPLHEEALFVIANAVLAPSYISLESALSWYGLIPEGVWQVTSVTPQRTITHQTPIGRFDYHTIKRSAFWGDELRRVASLGKPYRIAPIEKALLDFFYLRTDIDSIHAIEALRFNPEIAAGIDLSVLKRDAVYFHNKQFEKRISLLIEHLRHA